jgi:5'-nucleotidase
LDAGDQYQGTVWFSVHKGQAAGYFMNRLGYDAMALGNHEFDNSIDGLIPFLRNVTFPIVCSNINTSHEPRMAGLFNKSVVLTVGGQRIGVVGYIAKETPALSKTGQLNFLDEVSSVQSEVDRLTGEGVNKIIALGHAGIKTDRALAAKVRGIDVVVGGHTNTFLYTGKEPAEEKAEDVYPIVISQPTTGDRVLVTQAYAFGKYLGFLKVTFDGDGRVVMWDGNPRLMDNTVEPDAEILEELVPWRAPIDAMYHINVGVTLNKLDGDFVVCRTKECTMGDVIADAMIDHYRRQLPQLSDVSIALLNGGSIRSTIDTGNVTYADVMEVLPFGTTIDVVELSGADVREVLEYAVQDYDPCSRHGKFLQVAGLQVTYDLSRPNNQRVAEVEVAINGSGSQYVPLDNNTIYKVSMTSFMAQGGDGYDMVTRKSRQHYNLGIVDTDLLMQYIARQTPLDVQTDGRIRFLRTHRVRASSPEDPHCHVTVVSAE